MRTRLVVHTRIFYLSLTSLSLCVAVGLFSQPLAAEAAGVRHKGVPGQWNQPGQKPPPGSGLRSKSKGSSSAPTQENSGLSADTSVLYENPAAGNCSFQTRKGFAMWRLRNAVAVKNKFITLAQSQDSREPTWYLAETEGGSLKFPAKQISFWEVQQNPESSDVLALGEQGLWIYRAQNQKWENALPERKFQSARWGTMGQIWTTSEAGLQSIHFSANQSTSVQDHSLPQASWQIQDRALKLDRLLLLKKISDTQAELYVWSKAGLHRLNGSQNVLQAKFAADANYILSVEDNKGTGASVWIVKSDGSSRRPLGAETLPVSKIALSPDRLSLSIENQDWGIHSHRALKLSANGTPFAETPTATEDSLADVEYGSLDKAIAVEKSPLDADRIVRIENGTSQVVWNQGGFTGCLFQWSRKPAVAADGKEFVVDIYTPKTAPRQSRQVIHLVKDRMQPPSPDFHAARTYWLQNGWTVIEPHLRGSREKGFLFYSSFHPKAWSEDFPAVMKVAEAAAESASAPWITLSETPASALPDFPTYLPIHFFCTDESKKCSSIDLARSLHEVKSQSWIASQPPKTNSTK